MVLDLCRMVMNAIPKGILQFCGYLKNQVVMLVNAHYHEVLDILNPESFIHLLSR